MSINRDGRKVDLPDRDGELSHPRTLDVCAISPVVEVDIPFGPAVEDLLERHAGLHPRQCRPETEAQALPERQMPTRSADIEATPTSGKCRSSRLAEPLSNNMTEPSGIFSPWHSVSWATYACLHRRGGAS